MSNPNYLYAGSQALDDGSPYFVKWDECDFGTAERNAPVIMSTIGGQFASFPLTTAFQARKGKISAYVRAADFPNKNRAVSDLASILTGSVVIHRSGRWLTAYFYKSPENAQTRVLGTFGGVEADFVATDPFWRLNQPLRGLDSPVNLGDEWDLYDDDAIPQELPDYQFTDSTFTFTNWGNIFCYGIGTITAGPVSSTVYLHGHGTTRLAVVLDASGNGSWAENQEFLLDVGENIIVVEDLAGAPIVPGASFVIDFGDTYMRFL